MTVVAFRARLPGPARSLEQLEARRRSALPTCDITIAKAARTRRYLLLADAPGAFLSVVYFGRALHRMTRVAGVHDARAVASQFARELRDLLEDGWTE